MLMPPTILTVKTAYYLWGAVLTNCGYEPLMISIVPNETSDTIQTALQHLQYRTGLSPKFITPNTMDGIFRDPAAHISSMLREIGKLSFPVRWKRKMQRTL